ncbi:MAG: hypothetical protein SOH80_06190 [Eubacteriales bacterium]|jgi:hypothetical protein
MEIRGKRKIRVIDDPAADAAEKLGVPCRIRKIRTVPGAVAPFCTTGQLEHADGRTYLRHCGPVAVTNALLALARREDVTVGASPEEIFRTVTEIGRRRGIYWNMNLFRIFGGTNDLRAGEYLRTCFRTFGLAAGVRFCQPLSGDDLLHPVRKEHLLYLELWHHPLYGSHHLICCGACETVSIAARQKVRRKQYLAVADGWSENMRYLDLSEIGRCRFFEICPENDRQHGERRNAAEDSGV